MLVASLLLMTSFATIKAAAPIDWIERSPNGAYELAYATGDEGGHYKTEVATADNTITGKYGYRDPGSGAILETQYTAGRRGFRPRGPHIARRISLSQAGPVRPQDDGQYHPEFDGHDPSESQAYDFTYNTRETVKEEHADERGDVRGRYSYLDDLGVRRNVEYTAGANKGFNVLNSVPDSIVQAQSSPLVFQGKRPVGNIRGLTAVQKSPDGSYRFAASGPDHKRAEAKDALGNTRGSYSYIDDKGQQRTVEYIAGPNIGFQIINGRRPLLPALFPNIPGVTATPGSLSQFFPDVTSTISPLLPDLPSTTTSSFFSDLFSASPSPPSSPLGQTTSSSGGRPTPPTTFPGGPTTPSSSFPGQPSSDRFPERPSSNNNMGRPPSEGFPGRPSSGRPTSDTFPSLDNFPSGTPTPTSPTSPDWTPSSTPQQWLDDFGSLHHQLFPEGGRDPVQAFEQPSGSCCKGSWHTGPLRGRAVRAHVQSIDVSQRKHMSPGDALELHS